MRAISLVRDVVVDQVFYLVMVDGVAVSFEDSQSTYKLFILDPTSNPPLSQLPSLRKHSASHTIHTSPRISLYRLCAVSAIFTSTSCLFPPSSYAAVGWECRTKGTARRPLIHSMSWSRRCVLRAYSTR